MLLFFEYTRNVHTRPGKPVFLYGPWFMRASESALCFRFQLKIHHAKSQRESERVWLWWIQDSPWVRRASIVALKLYRKGNWVLCEVNSLSLDLTFMLELNKLYFSNFSLSFFLNIIKINIINIFLTAIPIVYLNVVGAPWDSKQHIFQFSQIFLINFGLLIWLLTLLKICCPSGCGSFIQITVNNLPQLYIANWLFYFSIYFLIILRDFHFHFNCFWFLLKWNHKLRKMFLARGRN